jgi:DNA-binding helix-hairpin-helix protein with protein kinase domain
MPFSVVLWVGVVLFAWIKFLKTDFDSAEWLDKYSLAEARYDRAIADWRKAVGVGSIEKLRRDLEATVKEYRGLSTAKALAVTQLTNSRHSQQKHEFLDRFLLRSAKISGIGPARMVTLASYGIETAADIERNRIMQIPGFGPSTASKLLDWRSQQERKFVYNPSYNQSDTAKQTKLEADFANRAAVLAKKITAGRDELLKRVTMLNARIQLEVPRLNEIAEERSQLEVDLEFLEVDRVAAKLSA